MSNENWSDEMTDDDFAEMMSNLTGMDEREFLESMRATAIEGVIEEMDQQVREIDMPEIGVSMNLNEGQAFVLAQKMAVEFGWGGGLVTLSDLESLIEHLTSNGKRSINVSFSGVLHEAMSERCNATYAWDEMYKHVGRLTSSLTAWEIGILELDPAEIVDGFAEQVKEELAQRNPRDVEIESFEGVTPAQAARDLNHPASQALVEELPPFAEQEGIPVDYEKLKVDGEYRFWLLCECVARSHGVEHEVIENLYEEER